jgi:hypothetical protein
MADDSQNTLVSGLREIFKGIDPSNEIGKKRLMELFEKSIFFEFNKMLYTPFRPDGEYDVSEFIDICLVEVRFERSYPDLYFRSKRVEITRKELGYEEEIGRENRSQSVLRLSIEWDIGKGEINDEFVKALNALGPMRRFRLELIKAELTPFAINEL